MSVWHEQWIDLADDFASEQIDFLKRELPAEVTGDPLMFEALDMLLGCAALIVVECCQQGFRAALGTTRMVNTDQTIRFGSVRYSVPPGLVGAAASNAFTPLRDASNSSGATARRSATPTAPGPAVSA